MEERILLTVQDAAEMLSVSQSQMYEILNTGALHKVYLTDKRNRFRIDRAELQAYADSLPRATMEEESSAGR